MWLCAVFSTAVFLLSILCTNTSASSANAAVGLVLAVCVAWTVVELCRSCDSVDDAAYSGFRTPLVPWVRALILVALP